MITIFTPTYNRAYIINKLYNSLCYQTSKDFEWVIVDDGSIDNTESLIKEWTQQKLINITYIKQNNGGKHRAINRGVKSAKGELFFIVDSDDYLAEDAVESIEKEWNTIKNNPKVVGLCFRKVNYITNEIIGKPFPINYSLASTLQIHYTWKIYNDKAEVFKTQELKKHPFPEIENEKFFSEGYIWNKIAGNKNTLLYCINKGIYYCEYLDDGLTKNFNKLLKQSPKGFIIYYSSLLKHKIVWKHPISIMKITIRLLQSYYYSTKK